jgi:hypothetical protein
VIVGRRGRLRRCRGRLAGCGARRSAARVDFGDGGADFGDGGADWVGFGGVIGRDGGEFAGAGGDVAVPLQCRARCASEVSTSERASRSPRVVTAERARAGAAFRRPASSSSRARGSIASRGRSRRSSGRGATGGRNPGGRGERRATRMGPRCSEQLQKGATRGVVGSNRGGDTSDLYFGRDHGAVPVHRSDPARPQKDAGRVEAARGRLTSISR